MVYAFDPINSVKKSLWCVSEFEFLTLCATLIKDSALLISIYSFFVLQFLPQDSISIDTVDLTFPEDNDFKDDVTNSVEPEEFSLMGISSAQVYACCINTSKYMYHTFSCTALTI